MFKIIDGGNTESAQEKKDSISSKAEQLKIFVSHMRSLEYNISAIKTMALKIEWEELDAKLTLCHKQILDTLSFVKQTSKDKEQDKKNLEKPIKSHLKIIKDNNS